MIYAIWLVSFMSASPWALFTKVNYLVYEGTILEESAWCSIPFNEETSGSLYMMLGSTILYFFVPLVIVVLMYARQVLSDSTCLVMSHVYCITTVCPVRFS